MALSQSAGMCCIWNLCCPGRAELCSELRLEGADAAGVLAVGHDDVAATRARSPRRARLTDLGLLAKEEAPPALLATAGEAARIAVHETRTGYRSVLEIDERRTVKVLRFAASGRLRRGVGAVWADPMAFSEGFGGFGMAFESFSSCETGPGRCWSRGTARAACTSSAWEGAGRRTGC